MRLSPLVKLALFAAAGAVLGFGYYYFIGCRTGTCPLTSNPVITTFYGLIMGVVAGFDLRLFKKRTENKDERKDA